MLVALFADIHANREAFVACLAHAQARNPARFIFLGDHVNYGADPEWIVETLMNHVSGGSIALMGNHDAAVGLQGASLASPAASSMEWTRRRLTAAQRSFLAGLPLTFEEADHLFVHADASAPHRWNYVVSRDEASRSLAATQRRITFCGHVHSPAIYCALPGGQLTFFRPVAGSPVPLLPQRRWLVVLGSVGQPRDGSPAASYALLDTWKEEVTYYRVPYDVETAARKIRDAGLPEEHAERLRWGY